MKFAVAIVLTALLSFAASLFFPWWIIAVTSFVVGALIYQRALNAFITGFLGLFLLWGVQAYYIDSKNGHLLSIKVAQLLKLGSSSMLILVTALVGGLVGAFAAMTGSLLRRSV